MNPRSLARIAQRAYSTRLPTKPRVRTNDPLANSPRAAATPLPDDLTFIHRPPPTIPTPHSLTTNPASALLRPPTAGKKALAPLPPQTRRERPPGEPWAGDDIVHRIRRLRGMDPLKWSRSALADEFKVTQHFVSMIAPLKQKVRKVFMRKTAEEHDRRRAMWGDKRRAVVEARNLRREFW